MIKRVFILLLSISILAFPSMGLANAQEQVLDESVEEVERISEHRSFRLLLHIFKSREPRNNGSNFHREDERYSSEQLILTLPKRYLVNRVLRL